VEAIVDFGDSPAEAAFRAELRAWIADQVPFPAIPDDDEARVDYLTAWQQRLHAAGWVAVTFPEEYGGRGLDPIYEAIVLDELGSAGAPPVWHYGYVAQVLLMYGTEEQKHRYVPSAIRGEERWCQGFSEPDAGSDLAAMRTRAVRDGDDYVVTGHKIWTSYAGVADWCELLVRTDPDAPKHRGISWLILPMDSPGIEIRPLKTLLGSSEFSEVFLDEVRVPVANLVGAENDGWRVTMVTLSFERGTAWVDQIVDSVRLVADLGAIASKVTSQRAAAWDDRGLRRDIGHLAAEFDALWALTKRGVTEASTGSGVPGPGASVLKLRYTEARQRLMDVAARVLDRGALSRADIADLPNGVYVEERLNSLSYTIAAGTSQIQRNIIGERILGLPRR
jgi:alkylation response protein AidB-like acyl-CoA dehydrogenase